MRTRVSPLTGPHNIPPPLTCCLCHAMGNAYIPVTRSTHTQIYASRRLSREFASLNFHSILLTRSFFYDSVFFFFVFFILEDLRFSGDSEIFATSSRGSEELFDFGFPCESLTASRQIPTISGINDFRTNSSQDLLLSSNGESFGIEYFEPHLYSGPSILFFRINESSSSRAK